MLCCLLAVLLLQPRPGAALVLEARQEGGEESTAGRLENCGIPSNSSFNDANCRCIESNALNCLGRQGMELICTDMTEFYAEEGPYNVQCL